VDTIKSAAVAPANRRVGDKSTLTIGDGTLPRALSPCTFRALPPSYGRLNGLVAPLTTTGAASPTRPAIAIIKHTFRANNSTSIVSNMYVRTQYSIAAEGEGVDDIHTRMIAGTSNSETKNV
jgi:hypothetical protein